MGRKLLLYSHRISAPILRALASPGRKKARGRHFKYRSKDAKDPPTRQCYPTKHFTSINKGSDGGFDACGKAYVFIKWLRAVADCTLGRRFAWCCRTDGHGCSRYCSIYHRSFFPRVSNNNVCADELREDYKCDVDRLHLWMELFDFEKALARRVSDRITASTAFAKGSHRYQSTNRQRLVGRVFLQDNIGSVPMPSSMDCPPSL